MSGIGHISFNGWEGRQIWNALNNVGPHRTIRFEAKRMAGPRKLGNLKKEWDKMIVDSTGPGYTMIRGIRP